MWHSTKPNPKDIKNYESTLDSIANEIISLLDDKETELRGKSDNTKLIDAYCNFSNTLQAKAKELYPDFNFENF